MSDTSESGRQWSSFEMQTMAALITKGAHLEAKGRRSDSPDRARRQMELDFATQFNQALHGKNYEFDIPQHEIITKLREVLETSKDAVALAERTPGARLTRTVNFAFKRRNPTRARSGAAVSSTFERGRSLGNDTSHSARHGINRHPSTPPSNVVTKTPAHQRISPQFVARLVDLRDRGFLLTAEEKQIFDMAEVMGVNRWNGTSPRSRMEAPLLETPTERKIRPRWQRKYGSRGYGGRRYY